MSGRKRAWKQKKWNFWFALASSLCCCIVTEHICSSPQPTLPHKQNETRETKAGRSQKNCLRLIVELYLLMILLFSSSFHVYCGSIEGFRAVTQQDPPQKCKETRIKKNLYSALYLHKTCFWCFSFASPFISLEIHLSAHAP